MPPKKKRKLVFIQNAPPGIGKRHLNEKFSHLPLALDDLKNGHVLHIYVSVASSSPSATARHLVSHYFPAVKGSFRTSSNMCINHIRMLKIHTLLKYRKLSNSKEFKKFSEICDKPFHLDVADPAVPSTSGTFAVKHVPDSPDPGNTEEISNPTSTPDKHLPILPPISSVVSTRSQSETLPPQMARMKKRLAFVSAATTEMKKRYLHTVRDLRAKLKLHRCRNQAIQRKNNIIQRKKVEISSLREKLEGNSLANELEKTRLELRKLKEAHKKLLKYHKGKKVSSSSAVSTSEYELIQEKDEIIREFDHQKVLVQDKTDDYESERKASGLSELKSDGKTYSTSTRLMVFDNIVNHLPTKNIPILMSQTQICAGEKPSDVPQRTTVEIMTQDLMVITKLQTVETD